MIFFEKDYIFINIVLVENVVKNVIHLPPEVVLDLCQRGTSVVPIAIGRIPVVTFSFFGSETYKISKKLKLIRTYLKQYYIIKFMHK